MAAYLRFVILSLIVSVSASAADTLTIVLGGDVLFDRGVRKVINSHGYDHLFSGIAPVLREADAAVVNLECPLTMRHRSVKKKYIFRGDTIAAAAMHRAGITHAALANNHSVDQGLLGLDDTWQSLADNSISAIGYSTSPDSLLKPALIEAKGITVALFNAVTIPIENWLTLPAEGKPAICSTSADSLAAAVSRFHTARPEVPIVVFVHWGREFTFSPVMQQQMGAAALVRAGATAIIGQHPHVVQPQQILGRVPVWYSIGNLVFDQKPAECNKAQLVRLRFTNKGMIGYDTIPVQIEECRPIAY